jgi:hypothetical protein
MSSPENLKPGRPLTGDTPASGHIHLRVTMERKNKYVRAAQIKKMKLSEWMILACDGISEK